MEIIRMTTLGLFYLGLIIQKVLIFFALPLLVFIIVSTLILLVKSSPVVAFFAFTALIFAIGTGSSKPSTSGDHDVDPIFYLNYYVVPYEGDQKDQDYDDISGLELVSTSYMSSSDDLDSIFYLPQGYVVAYEGEKIQEEDYGDDNNDDEFCPRLVYVEYKDKSVESVSNNLSLTVMKYEEKVVKRDYYHENSGFHGYAHDGGGPHGGGGGGGDIEDERDVLKRRIEEFIEKNNRKWEEEMFNDKLTHFAPTDEWQYAVAG